MQDEYIRKMKTIKMILKNHLGEIESSELSVSDEELENIINLAKTFYQDDVGFEMWTDTGFVVIAPEITKHSILTIKLINNNVDEKHTIPDVRRQEN